MRQLSDKCREQIALLHKKPGLADRVLHRSLWNLDAIVKLGGSGEPAAIPYLFPILFSSNTREIVVAAQAIKALLSEISAADLPWLDESIRHSQHYWLTDTWHKIHSRELAKWVGPGEPGALLLQLASLHPNGYVREEAVRRLNLIHDGSELPYILLRLNDWVAQVRQRAHSAILERIKPEYANRFIQNLALIVRLQEAQRNDVHTVLEQITLLLRSPTVHQEMVNMMNSDSRILRRASFQILKTAAPQLIPDVLMSALKVEDHVIRLHAARAAVDALSRSELKPILLSLLRDTSASIRLEALRALVTKFPEESTDQLTAGLLDSNATVRYEVRYWLGKNNGSVDFRQLYQDATMAESSRTLTPAIAGLAEVGLPEDAKQLTRFLSHPRAVVRKTTVRHLIKLGGEQYFDNIFDRVLEDSPSVSNQAREVAKRLRYRLNAFRIWEHFTEAKFPHVQRNLLHLLAELPKWERITYLLRAIHEGDESIATHALNYVLLWDRQYSRSQTTPSPQQIAQLEVALKVVEGNLPKRIVASLQFAIRSYRAD